MLKNLNQAIDKEKTSANIFDKTISITILLQAHADEFDIYGLEMNSLPALSQSMQMLSDSVVDFIPVLMQALTGYKNASDLMDLEDSVLIDFMKDNAAVSSQIKKYDSGDENDRKDLASRIRNYHADEIKQNYKLKIQQNMQSLDLNNLENKQIISRLKNIQLAFANQTNKVIDLKIIYDQFTKSKIIQKFLDSQLMPG